MSRLLVSRTIILGLAAALAACGDIGQSDSATPTPETASPEPTIELRVMSFNIEWGGANISFANVVEAIRRADADIVGIQEAQGKLQRLAGELGWHYDLRNYVISRYPLLDPPGADGSYVYAEVEPGRAVAVANVHLPSVSPGPELVRDGAAPQEVLENEHAERVPLTEAFLAGLAPLVERDMPLFLTGDFNAPAHTDWTAEAVGTRPFLRYALDWPVSRAVAAAGFRDSWREVYPDPVANPGLTWWAGRPPLELYDPGENDPRDRIDFVWFSGPVTVRSSQLVGEQGGPEVSVSVAPWPSDHRGVVSRFSVRPAPLPALVTTPLRVYRSGEAVEVVYRQPLDAGATLTVTGQEAAAGVITEHEITGGGRLELPADLFTPGGYRVVMELSGGGERQEREFWVLDRDAAPVVEIAGRRYGPGEPIEFTWRNGPGNRNDYVAVYRAEIAAGYGNELAWTYLDALPGGRKRLDESTAQWVWPLEPGTYVLRLLEDDGYQQLAESSTFIVE